MKRETKREMDGLCPKGHADTADHPGRCPGQNILEIKNSGHWPHLVGKGKEDEVLLDQWGGHLFLWYLEIKSQPFLFQAIVYIKLYKIVYIFSSWFESLQSNLCKVQFFSIYFGNRYFCVKPRIWCRIPVISGRYDMHQQIIYMHFQSKKVNYKYL